LKISQEQYNKLPDKYKGLFAKGGDFGMKKVNDGRKTEIDNAFQRGETLRRNTHPT
jgi:hypothetical protein